MLKNVIIFSLSFICVLVFRAIKLPDHANLNVINKNINLQRNLNISTFQEAIKFKTICWNENKINLEELDKLVQFIIKKYRRIHSFPNVKWKRVANYSLLYEIKGSNNALLPYLLMGHLDVVPVEQKMWTQPAFDGHVIDGYIYGRGTLDDKHNVFAILETLEYALSKDFKPKRSLLIAFGHDEECNGKRGAFSIGKMLKENGYSFEFILDEGLMIIEDLMPDIPLPVASIGVTEKGYLTLKLSTNDTGGHSSVPPSESCIGILAKAVAKLEENLHESRLGYGPEEEMLIILAGQMNIFKKILFANMWLFRPIISWLMRKTPVTNAMISTTTAVTVFHAGIKENVIPVYAEAIVNHRIHPSQNTQQILLRDIEIVGDARVKFEVLSSFEPHRISSYSASSLGYNLIKRTILQIFNTKSLLVVPSIMLANTDTKHYLDLSLNVYRFSPLQLRMADVSRIHGADERIAITAYQQMIDFYYQLITNVEEYVGNKEHDHHIDL